MSAARRRVQLGRALRHMPAAEAAWLAGDMGEAHVALLAAARTPDTAGCFEGDEGVLVAQARELQYRHFTRALAYWGQLADPDGAEDDAAPSTMPGGCTCRRPSGRDGSSTGCSTR